jgi:hypothetical protein
MARIGQNTKPRSTRWLYLVVAILVGTLTACSTPIPGTPSAAPGPPSAVPGPLRPRDIPIDNVDPCTLLTPEQRAELRLDRPPQPARQPSLLYPGEVSSCSTRGTESPNSIYVQVVTTAGIEFFTSGQTASEVRLIEMAGFPAAVAKPLNLDDSCKVLVDVAPGQMLDVQARALLQDPPIPQDQVCSDAEQAANMAMDTLLNPPAPSEPPAGTTPHTADQPAPSNTPTAADVGAPFDPCRTLTWADFPEKVRRNPDDPGSQPKLMEVKPDSGFATGCRFDNSLAEIEICPGCDTPPKPGTWQFFMTHVVWGDGPGAQLRNPPAPGTKQITVGGRPGRVIQDRTDNGDPQCLIKVVLERGAATVSVVDGRFGTDTCATARQLATAIVERSA